MSANNNQAPIDSVPSEGGFLSATQGMGLPDLLRLVNRRRNLILYSLGICLIGAMGYYLFSETKYESSVQLLVMKKDSKLAARGAEGASEEDSRVSEDLLSTHMQIVQSKQIVSAALEKYGYDKLPSIVDNLDTDEDATDFVIDRLDVTRGGIGQAKGAHVLNVSFRHTSPEESQQIVQAIVESYRNFLNEKFQDVSKEAAVLIKQASVDLAEDVKTAEQTYQEFRENAPLLWKGDESANIHRVRYEELEAALGEIRMKTSEAKARLEVVRDAVEDQDKRDAPDLERLALLDDNNIQRVGLLVEVDKGDANSAEFQAAQPARLEGAKAEHEALLDLMLKEKTLRTDLGPEHPRMQELDRSIEMMKEFLEKKNTQLGLDTKVKLTPRNLVHAYVGLLQHDLMTLETRGKQLAILAEEERAAAKTLIKFELEGESLRKELARKQELFDTVVDRLREVNLMKDYAGFVTEVIAPPGLGEKVAPKFSLAILIGSALGLVFGAAAAGVAEYFDPMFMGPSDVVRTLNLPVLSALPLVGSSRDKEAALRSGNHVSPNLVSYHRPRSREAEVIRGLRTSLLYRLNDASKKVIQVTSAIPGDGKSTVSSNLAVSLSQVGRRVIIVDCDLRRPTVHKTFDLENKVGLTEVMLGQIEPSDAITPTAIENLSVLTCGSIPRNPAEMLSSPCFADLVAMLREKYDYVILDTPPLLAVADPCIVAKQADGVVITVRLTRDSRMQVLRSRDLLQASQAYVVGVVINSYDYKRPGDLAEYGYGYGYENYGHDDVADSYYVEDEEQHAAANGASTNGTSGNGTAGGHSSTNGHGENGANGRGGASRLMHDIGRSLGFRGRRS